MHIRWKHFPPRLVLAFKTFALAALDHPYPHDPSLPRKADQPSVATIVTWMRDLQVLAAWLDDRQIAVLAAITPADLDAYRDHVLALGCTPERKAYLLSAVRTLWAYRIHLPAACQISCDPWDGATGAAIAAPPPRPRFNTTPRIAPATMEPLLAWALRMTEDIGPDIAAAWREYRQLDDGTHPSQAALAGLTPRQRLEEYLRQARSSGQPLPGHDTGNGLTVNYSHLARILGFSKRRRLPALAASVEEAGLRGRAADRARHLPRRDQRPHQRPAMARPAGHRRRTRASGPATVRSRVHRDLLLVRHETGGSPQPAPRLRQHRRGDRRTAGHRAARQGPRPPAHSPAWAAIPAAPGSWCSRCTRPSPCWRRSSPATCCSPRASPSLAAAAPPPRTRASTTDMNQDIEDFIAWVNAAFTGPAGRS